jgi:hypothetical protein
MDGDNGVARAPALHRNIEVAQRLPLRAREGRDADSGALEKRACRGSQGVARRIERGAFVDEGGSGVEGVESFAVLPQRGDAARAHRDDDRRTRCLGLGVDGQPARRVQFGQRNPSKGRRRHDRLVTRNERRASSASTSASRTPAAVMRAIVK